MGLFCTLASGSTGNCSLYRSGAFCVLIDAGISTRCIARGLGELGLRPADLTHILLTHSHTDHTKALPVLLKHTAAPVWCSLPTAREIGLLPDRARLLQPGQWLADGLPVTAFATNHDAPGSLGFVLGAGAGKLGYCTDNGHMTGEMLGLLAGCPTVVLESNHDVEMLEHGPYPWHLKQRVGSPYGHLSNDQCARAAAELVRRGTERLILAHLSQHNNTPALALETTCRVLEAEGLRAQVTAAPVERGTPIFWED
jgi:phosphoribosyl 1,2-cyclic phosphodiesterase